MFAYYSIDQRCMIVSLRTEYGGVKCWNGYDVEIMRMDEIR